MTTKQKFAFMCLDSDGITDQEAMDRILNHVRRLGINPKDFKFQKYNYLPEQYEDSFSRSYVKAAIHLNIGYSLMVASNDLLD